MRNVFNRLGQNAEEDLRAHLEARRTSTSSKKNNVPIFSPMHDEINELRKKLDKLVAKSLATTPSTNILAREFSYANHDDVRRRNRSPKLS